MTDTNPRLAELRAPFFEEMDSDPDLEKLFIQAALCEGGKRALQANFEQMCNYGNARGFRSLAKILHSGFYGPVNRGEAAHRHISYAEMDAAKAALAAVRAGSNLINYRTDQGTPGDPNFRLEASHPHYRGKWISGCFFADHPMFDKQEGGSWASRQLAADAARGAAPQAVQEASA